MGDRSARMRSTMSDTFWVLVLSIVVLFAFFIALGAFHPGEVAWLTLAVLALAAAVGGPRRVGRPPPLGPRPRGDPQPRAAGLLSSTTLDPEIAKILEGMLAFTGPPAHEVPIEQARAGHEAETEHLSGPGEPVAEVRDLEIPAPSCTIPARAVPAGGRTRRCRWWSTCTAAAGCSARSSPSTRSCARSPTRRARSSSASATGSRPRRRSRPGSRTACARSAGWPRNAGRARRRPRAAGGRRRQRRRQPRGRRRAAPARRGRRCACRR